MNERHRDRSTQSDESAVDLQADRLLQGAQKLWSQPSSTSWISPSRRSGPIGRLIERLDAEDGPDWLERSLREPVFQYLGDAGAAALLEKTVSLRTLLELRERAKLLPQGEADAQGSVGTLAYLLSTAAIKLHHGRDVGGRPWKDYCAALEELALVIPPPWDDLLMRASELEN